MQGQNDFSSYCRSMYERNIADELFVKYAIFSEILVEPCYSLNKMAYFRTSICREFSEVTSHLTLPNCNTELKSSYSCSRMSNSTSKLLCSHKQTILCKLDENNKMELEIKLSPVSCVTSQLGARPWVCFRKIIGNE